MLFMKYETCSFAKTGRLVNTANRFAVCWNKEGAKQLGAILAKRALEKGIENVVFDRSGYLYHGRIMELADGAREAGLKF